MNKIFNKIYVEMNGSNEGHSNEGHNVCKKLNNQINCDPSLELPQVGHLTRKSGVRGWIPGLVTYFRFSFRFFKKGSCQLLGKVCARSTG